MKINLILVVLISLVAGCATAQRSDPLEGMNRKVFAFNEVADKYVVAPVAKGYKAVTPEPVRNGITNFFSNLGEPWSAVNALLQGRPFESVSDLGRFGTNTIAGGLGFFDVATGWGLPRRKEDFGQTLGVWGVEPGAYLVLPLLGPSDLRDTAAIPVDRFGSFESQVDNVALRNSLTGVDAINMRASVLGVEKLLDDLSFDKYSFLRNAYLERRRSAVRPAPDDTATRDNKVPSVPRVPE